MSTGTILLLGVFTALLVGFIWSGVLLLRAQEEDAQLKKRLNAVTGSEETIKPIETPASLVAAQADEGILHQITGFFGFDLEKQEFYPIKWYLALAGVGLAAFVVAWLMEFVIGSVAAVFVPFLFYFFSRQFFGWCINRRKDKLFRQFPDALAMIVRSVRAGIPVSESIRAVAREVAAPTGGEFGRLADEISIGVPLDKALHIMAERNDLSEYRFFATALTLQNQTGGGLSETLDNLGDVIRKRVALRERGRALASEAKTSAGILASLPPLSGLGLWALNPDYISVLFVDPSGRMVLFSAILMLASGIWVMRTIIQKSLQ